MPGRERVPLIAGAALLAYSLSVFAAGLVVDLPLGWLGWVPLPVMALLAASACYATYRRPLDLPTRLFWRRLGHCCVLLVAALVSNAWDALSAPDGLQQRLGPVTTVLYVVVLIAVVWALLRLPAWVRTRAEWARFWLDASIVLLTTGILVWHFVLQRAQSWTEQTGSTVPVLIVVMVTSVSAIALGKVAFTGTGRVDRKAMQFLAVGVAAGSACGPLVPLLASRPQLNSAYVSVPVVTFAVIVSARRQATRASLPAKARPVARGLSVLPYLAVVGLDAMLLGSDLTRSFEGRLIAGGTVAITALVVIRQVTALRENDRLLKTVDAGLRQLRAYQDKLDHQVRHDALTEVANRPAFEERARAHLAAGQGFLVALLDLDDFKGVNDRLGHGTGDALLRAISARLRERLRAEDTVARLGGDEFTLLLPGLAAEDAGTLLERLAAAVGEPVLVDGHRLVTRVSIGVTANAPGDTPGELLRRADVAMYAAKHAGGGRWAWFDPGMDTDARLGADLRQAAALGQLSVVYQPIVELPGGAMNGVEALVRWRHPEHGDVSPAVFIPLAERNGAIIEVGRWVLERVLAQSAAWSAGHGTAAPRRISVNVSARQLQEPGYVAEVAAALERSGVSPSRIVIEVTETAVLGTGIGLEAVRGLNALGLRVALDDFGTGASSLSLLVDCPVDILKVDKSFVDGVLTDSPQSVIVDQLIGITEGLRIKAIAEGVETAEQAHRLYAAGYRYAQGYHFARPMSAADIDHLLVAAAAPVRP